MKQLNRGERCVPKFLTRRVTVAHITVLSTSSITSHQISPPTSLIQHHITHEHSSSLFCPPLRSLRIKSLHQLHSSNITSHMNTPYNCSVHLFDHFASNLSTNFTHPTSHHTWTLLITVLSTSSITSHQISPPTSLIQHHITHQHSSPLFCPPLRSLRIKSLHQLHSSNITSHINTPHHCSVHLFDHFASNLSTNFTHPTSHHTSTLLTTVLSTSSITSHQISPPTSLIQHHITHEHSLWLFCPPLRSLRIKSLRPTSLIQHHITHEHSSLLFCPPLRSLRIKSLHQLHSSSITSHINTPQHTSVHLFDHFASNLSTNFTHPTSHHTWTLLITVLSTSSITSHQISPPTSLIQHHITHQHSSPLFCPPLRSLRIKSLHQLHSSNITSHMNTPYDCSVHLFDHFASNLSTNFTHPTSHHTWTLLTTVLSTSSITSHQISPPTSLIQHHITHQHSLWLFCPPLRSLRIKSLHQLHSSNITSHMNTPHHCSVHLFDHFASNLSTNFTHPTSHHTWTLLTTVLSTSSITSHQISPPTSLIQHHITHEHSSLLFCPPLRSLRIKSLHQLHSSNITSHINTPQHTSVHLFDHFASNLFTNFTHPTSHHTWTLLNILFCPPLRSLRIKSLHHLHSSNITSHMNTPHHCSVHLFDHFASNLSTNFTHPISHHTCRSFVDRRIWRGRFSSLRWVKPFHRLLSVARVFVYTLR